MLVCVCVTLATNALKLQTSKFLDLRTSEGLLKDLLTSLQVAAPKFPDLLCYKLGAERISAAAGHLCSVLEIFACKARQELSRVAVREQSLINEGCKVRRNFLLEALKHCILFIFFPHIHSVTLTHLAVILY